MVEKSFLRFYSNRVHLGQPVEDVPRPDVRGHGRVLPGPALPVVGQEVHQLPPGGAELLRGRHAEGGGPIGFVFLKAGEKRVPERRTLRNKEKIRDVLLGL